MMPEPLRSSYVTMEKGTLIRVRDDIGCYGTKIVHPTKCTSSEDWRYKECDCKTHPGIDLKSGQIGLAVEYTAYRHRIEVVAWFGEDLVLAYIDNFEDA